MGALLIFLLQVLVAVGVTAVLFPVLLLAIPATGSIGPTPFYLTVAVVFLLLRIFWPRRTSAP